MKLVHDPLRRKDVALTPEEAVRQWFIGVLRDTAHVPEAKMMSEVRMQTGMDIGADRSRRKTLRADIVVYGREGAPVMVVECKRPETALDGEVVRQAMLYHRVLRPLWLVLTNGDRTLIWRLEGENYVPSDHLPDYDVIR